MLWFRKKPDFAGAHVVIWGGSTGIGLALACEFVQLRADVTLIARTQSKLDSANNEIQEVVRTQSLASRVRCISADVTDFKQVVDSVKRAEAGLGPVDIAISCAGAAYPGRFLDQGTEIFEKTMKLDYFGSLYVAKAVLPEMVQRKSGRILFVASPMAAIGFSGYSTYCPAKYAVRGLADVLRNELVGTGVEISLGYPLDTDTPGFATENLTKASLAKILDPLKRVAASDGTGWGWQYNCLDGNNSKTSLGGVVQPPETEAISRFAGGAVCSAEKIMKQKQGTGVQIAKSLVNGLQRGQYHIKTPELGVNLLLSATSGTTPKLYLLPLEMCLAPFLVALLAIYRRILDSFVLKQRQKEEAAQPDS